MPQVVCPDCLHALESGDETCLVCGFVRPADGWPPNPLPGLILGGRYRLEAPLGAGGMASVYRAARIGALGGNVAVKVLAPRFSRTVVARRFEREAQVVSRLTNPHIVRIYDFDTFSLPDSPQPLYYLAMELVEGATLTQLLAKQGRVNFLWGIDVLRQIARGLDEAHQAGITHRDLKPANLMLVQQREATHVKILDFGIAALTGKAGESLEKLTQTGFVSGTPDYMAPEQAVGDADLGPPADMYSLGVIAFEIFSGTLPFVGETAMDVLMKRLSGTAPSLREACQGGDFPPDLYPIVDKLLQRDVRARYQNAGELLDDLARFPAMQTAPDFIPDAEMVARYHEAVRERTREDAAQAAPTLVAKAESRTAPAPEATQTGTMAATKQGSKRAWLLGLAFTLLAGGAAAVFILTRPAGTDSSAPGADLSSVTTATAAAADADTSPSPAEEVGAASAGDLGASDGAAAAPAASERPAAPDTTSSPAPASAQPDTEPSTIEAAAPEDGDLLGHARPPLEPGFVPHVIQLTGLRLTVAVPDKLPPLYKPTPLRIALDRAGDPLRLTSATARVFLFSSNQTVAQVTGRGRTQDGRVALELPPLPLAGVFGIDLTPTTASGEAPRIDLFYTSTSGLVESRPGPP